MSRILKNILPYWKSVIAIIILLVMQAACDLALPQYTSNIIDVGIINGGIEHILPASITTEEYETARLFFTEEENQLWDLIYDKDDNNYVLNISDKETLDEYDDKFSVALLLNNQMSAVTKEMFISQLSAKTGVSPSLYENMSIEQIGQMMGIQLSSFIQTMEDENGNEYDAECVDMRIIFSHMLETGMIGKDEIISMRDQFKPTFDTLGSSMIKSMGIAYAKKMDKKAGLDMDKIQTGYLISAGIKMIGMALLIALTSVCVGLLASRLGAGIGRSMRDTLYKKVLGFSNTEMDKFSTASLITRTTNDVQQIQMVTVLFLRMILYAPILGIGGIIKVTQTGSGMGYIIVIAVASILTFVMLLMCIAMPKFKIMQKLIDNVNLVAREILTGLSVIRAFGREQKEEQRFDDANKALTKTMLFTNRTMTFMMPVMTMIMNAISVTIIWVAAHRIDDGIMQVGSMTAFLTYSMQIVMSFLMLTMLSILLPRAIVSAERIDEVINTQSSISDKTNPLELNTNNGIIAFENVSFKYPGAENYALEDISFVAKPGQTTAIIGSTGCGKTTLVNLIPRLYDVSSGRITFDGLDIRDISMKDLRSRLGYVPQKGILFSGTINSNLRFGKEDATTDEVFHAAEIAQATEFINEKPEGFDSSIAQGGSNVSGGQKQRLSIARAIAKKPKVLIFDDSFSALDLKTDAALRKALSDNVSDTTVIIVAQRISTILNAEQILVMEDGRIVGKGTHNELLQTCETYRQIAKSQLSEKELGLSDDNNNDKEEL